MKLQDDFKIEIIDVERSLRVTVTLGELRDFLLTEEVTVTSGGAVPEPEIKRATRTRKQARHETE